MGDKSSNGIQLSQFVHVYSVFKISTSSAPGGAAGGWGVCRVIRVSLDEFKNVQR